MKVFLTAASLLVLAVVSPASAQVSPDTASPDTVAARTTCGLQQAAFCETFSQSFPANPSSRSGQLDPVLWGVSRAIGGSGTNFGQGLLDGWVAQTGIQTCNGFQTVAPEQTVQVCNGQLREAVDDNADVIVQAMYPKQPFDFAGRTGIIAFDVSNNSIGTHTQWPEIWITDQPVPTPFTHFASWLAAPRNGVGLRFAAATAPGQGHNIAPACPDDGNERWSADSVVVSRDYIIDDEAAGTANATKLQALDCVIGSPGPEAGLNHVEVHVSQNQIDVYATDAGTTSPLHHIATVPNVNLSFTRGLVWLEDVHYNSHKFGGNKDNTFSWANLGFDGPVLPRDLTFDVADALTSAPYGLTNLGWGQNPNQATTKTISPGPTQANIDAAQAFLVTFNFFHYSPPTTITATVNGHVHTIAWPFPDTSNPNGGGSWRTLAIPLAPGDVVAGPNTVSVSTNAQNAVANVDLVLAGAGGGQPQPTSTPTPFPTATSVPTVTAQPTGTPVAVHTCQVLANFDGVQKLYDRPLSFCMDQ